MNARGLTWALVGGFLAWCGAAWGADEPLDVFPDSTSVVVHLKSPEKTFDKVVEFVKQANADELQLIDGLDVLAGNDQDYLRCLQIGGAGCISVAAHIVAASR